MNDEPATAAALIPHEILPRARDLGDGFTVQRVLPAAQRRMVGPFVFFDQFGPVEFAPGRGIDVRPHPHIGLATVTYLFEGGIVHRDSLGYVQPIAPGDVNWMTAGRGIVHSERTDAEARRRPQRLQGIQIWVALPQRHEETAPAFAHYPAATLPLVEGEGKSLRIVAGTLFGQRSPVATLLRSLLRRRHSDPRRRAPAGRRACRARRLPARRRHRDRRPRLRPRPPPGLRPRPPADDPRSRGIWRAVAPAAARRRAARRSRAISGGTSSPAARTASSRPRKTGSRAASRRCPAKRNSFRCRTRPSTTPSP